MNITQTICRSLVIRCCLSRSPLLSPYSSLSVIRRALSGTSDDVFNEEIKTVLSPLTCQNLSYHGPGLKIKLLY